MYQKRTKRGSPFRRSRQNVQPVHPLQVEGGVDQVSFACDGPKPTEQELAEAAARADRTGMYTCPHTGVALAVLFKLVERGGIRSDDRVVVVSTAQGLKFTDFKVGYHQNTLPGVESRYANRPIELEASYDAVMHALDRVLDQGGEGAL